MAEPDTAAPSTRRHVFYVGGFFTGGPAFYRRYLVREAARHARVHGLEIEVLDRDGSDDAGSVSRHLLRASDGTGLLETRYDLLRWEDIVLAEFAKPWSERLPQAVATFADYIANGAFGRMFGLMRRFAMVWLFPFLFYGLGAKAVALLGLAAALALLRSGLGDTPSFLLGMAASAMGLLVLAALGRISFAYLFLNDWIFSRSMALDRAPQMWVRVDEFAARIAGEIARNPADDFVLVGHSFGASLAPLVAARLPDKGVPENARLTLLTLGGSLPLIGFHPAATRFRSEVRRAASLAGCRWVDVSSSHDPINVKRFDPVAGLAIEGGSEGIVRSPKLVETRIEHGGRPVRFARLRLMRLHMQFIMASEKPGAYDYIGLIMGRTPIGDAAEALRRDRGQIR